MSTSDPTNELLRDVLDGYREEYKELADVWKQLDTKAQGTITVCGIFLAGVFAFARDIDDATDVTQKYLFSAATALLVFSVIFAMLALYVREVESPPYGDRHNDLAQDVIRKNVHVDADTRHALMRDQIRMWSKTNTDVNEANARKANCTLIAQTILVLAILCAAIATAQAIW